MCVLNREKLSQWDNMKDLVMYDILFDKFNQVKEAKDVLLLTGKSELGHSGSCVPAFRMHVLEVVRMELQVN